MEKGFFSQKIDKIMLKAKYSALVKKFNCSFSVDELIQTHEKYDLDYIFELEFRNIEKKIVDLYFDSIISLGRNSFKNAFVDIFKVLEFLLRKEYSKTGIKEQDMSVFELMKWARNRGLFDENQTKYFEAFRNTRNEITHHGKIDISQTEALFAIEKITEFIKKADK
jgi:hypothetical protein